MKCLHDAIMANHTIKEHNILYAGATTQPRGMFNSGAYRQNDDRLRGSYVILLL